MHVCAAAETFSVLPETDVRAPMRTDMQSPCSDEILMQQIIFIDLPPVESYSEHITGHAGTALSTATR